MLKNITAGVWACPCFWFVGVDDSLALDQCLQIFQLFGRRCVKTFRPIESQKQNSSTFRVRRQRKTVSLCCYTPAIAERDDRPVAAPQALHLKSLNSTNSTANVIQSLLPVLAGVPPRMRKRIPEVRAPWLGISIAALYCREEAE